MNHSARKQNAGAGLFDLFATPSAVATRPEFTWMGLLAGLPCVMFAMVLVGAPMVSQRRMSTWDRYQWSAVANLQRGNLPAALVDLKRLLSMRPGQPELIFTMAQIYDRQGKPDWAEALARSVAPANRPGYTPARKWLVAPTARKVSAEPKSKPRAEETALPPIVKTDGMSPPAVAPGVDPSKSQAPPTAGPGAEGVAAESAAANDSLIAIADRSRLTAPKGEFEVIEEQLRRWIAEAPEAIEPKAKLGLYYFRKGRFADARFLLQPVAEGRPLLLLVLAKSAYAEGDIPAMRRYAQEAGDASFRLSITHSNDPELRSAWALSCVLLDNYEGALEVLGGPNAPPPSAVQKTEMSNICAAWAWALVKSRPGQVAAFLSILQRGLTYDETNEALLAELAGLCSNSGKATKIVDDALQAMIREKRAPVAAYYAMGMGAWEKGRTAEGRQYLEQAYALNPHIPLMVNNLAWNLASTPPTDLDRALTLIDRALNESHSDRRFRVTRGEILCKIGSWEEAAAELERARADGENSPSLYAALAETRKHIGKSSQPAGPGK